MPQIENAADRRDARVGLRQIITMPPASVASLGGLAWLDQLSVLDAWQSRGHGSALINRTAETAKALGLDTLFLSTYRDVPWNGPFYARRGFTDVPRGEWPPALRQKFMTEGSHGHPSWRRTIMRRHT